jgi:hypothetical protein
MKGYREDEVHDRSGCRFVELMRVLKMSQKEKGQL